MKKILSIFFCLLFVSVAFAQPKFNGTKTEMNTAKAEAFTYTREFTKKDSTFTTTYKFLNAQGKQWADIQLQYEKLKKRITIAINRYVSGKPQQDGYEIFYTDSLGIVFGSSGNLKAKPTDKQNWIVCFTTEAKNYMKLIHAEEKPAKEYFHYTLDEVFDIDLTSNTKAMKNFPNAKPPVFNPLFPDKPVVTPAPAPAPAPPLPPTQIKTTPATTTSSAKTNVTEFLQDSIRIIWKPANNDIVSVRFFITGGVMNYNMGQEGIEALTLQMMTESGTKKSPKDLFNSSLDKMGTRLGFDCALDYSDVWMTCIASSFNNSWNLFSEALTAPAFPADEFKLNQDKMISAANSLVSSPDRYLNKLALQNVFGGRNYDKQVYGSVEALKKITLDDVKKYYASLLLKRKCFIVVVGNISKDDLKAKIKAAFASLRNSQVATPKYFSPEIFQPVMKTEERELPTNYLRGILNAPPVGGKEELAMRLAMSIISDRLFLEIRTKRNLSYAPSSSYAALQQAYASVYVSTTEPDQAAQVIIDVLKDVRKNGFTADELTNKKETFLTQYYMNLETNSALSQSLGVAEINGGWEHLESLMNDVYVLTLSDLNNVAKVYLKAISWTYLGDPSKVSNEILTQKLD